MASVALLEPFATSSPSGRAPTVNRTPVAEQHQKSVRLGVLVAVTRGLGHVGQECCAAEECFHGTPTAPPAGRCMSPARPRSSLGGFTAMFAGHDIALVLLADVGQGQIPLTSPMARYFADHDLVHPNPVWVRLDTDVSSPIPSTRGTTSRRHQQSLTAHLTAV